jgi:hypothetical protein
LNTKSILNKTLGEVTGRELAQETAKALGRFNISITNPAKKRRKFKSSNPNFAKAVRKTDKGVGF